MIELKLTLDELDYDALADRFLPVLTEQLRASGNPIGMLLSNGMSASMAKGILHGLSKEKKEQLAVDLLNGNKSKIIAALEHAAGQQGFPLHICDAQADRQG